MKKEAMYAGTFDPVTLGHFDLIRRSAGIFERVIIAVVASSPKHTLFSLDERIALTRETARTLPNVTVESFDGLLIDHARHRGVSVLIRGLRAYSDFEYEFRMALTNRKLAPEIETLFMMPSETQSYVSSSMVKEVALLGADVSEFVPPAVLAALAVKLRERRP